MKLEQLIPILETEEGWKETNCFLTMLKWGHTEWAEGLLSNLKEIIPSKQYSLIVRRAAIKLLNLCLEAGSDAFNKIVQEGTLLEALANHAIIESKAYENNKNADGEEQKSATIFPSILERFFIWSKQFPGTKFETLYKQLQDSCVEVPIASKPKIYVNGESQIKQGKEQNRILAQQSSVLSQKEGGHQNSAVHQDQQKNAREEANDLNREYIQRIKQMYGMLENLTNENQLNQFKELKEFFSEFKAKIDGSLYLHDSIREDQKEQLNKKTDQCEELCYILKRFEKKQIELPQMKEELQALLQKQMLESAGSAADPQQHSKVSRQSEIKNESPKKLQENYFYSERQQKSSDVFQHKQQYQSSIVQRQQNPFISAYGNSDSRQNVDEGLNHNNIAGLGYKQDIQQVQKFNQTNSPALINFFNERPISSSTYFQQGQNRLQSGRSYQQTSPVPFGQYFKEGEELTQQRRGQLSQVKSSIYAEEQKTLPNEKKDNLAVDDIMQNIKESKHFSHISDDQTENLEESLNNQTFTINQPYCFLVSQPENQNQNGSSQNQNGNGNNSLIQSQQQAACEKYQKGQSSQSKNVQHKVNYYSSQGDLSQIKSYAEMTQESFFGGKRVNYKNQIIGEELLNKSQEEINEILLKTVQELLLRIAQLEFTEQNRQTQKE